MGAAVFSPWTADRVAFPFGADAGPFFKGRSRGPSDAPQAFAGVARAQEAEAWQLVATLLKQAKLLFAS
jgi:hypothetical protein